MTEHMSAATSRLRDGINSGDPHQVAACFTEDYEAVVPLDPARNFVGYEQVGRNWAAIFAGVPNLQAQVLRFATRDSETWSEWKMEGTRADGAIVQMCGPAIWTERDGKISSSRFYLGSVTDSTM